MSLAERQWPSPNKNSEVVSMVLLYNLLINVLAEIHIS